MSRRSNLSDRKSNLITPNKLRQVRILQNPRMSQWKLALKSGVPQSKISLIENCLINPTQDEKESIATALNINEVEIFSNNQRVEGPPERGENENLENAG